ncbi:MAG: hypothetical protein ACLS6Y_02735 [Streptococcus salivarius]
MITDIYTISKDSGQVIRLTEGPQLGMLGERMTLAYLMDNTFSYYECWCYGWWWLATFGSDGQSLVKMTVIRVQRRLISGIGRT